MDLKNGSMERKPRRSCRGNFVRMFLWNLAWSDDCPGPRLVLASEQEF